MADKADLLGIGLRCEELKVGDRVVRIREPNVAEVEALDAADYSVGPDGNVRFNSRGHSSRWIAACVVDESGNRIFTTKEDEASIDAKIPAWAAKQIVKKIKAMADGTPAAVDDSVKNS